MQPKVRLKEWRGSRPLWKAAAELGFDASTMQRFEAGDRLPTLAQAARIQTVVGIDAVEWARPENAPQSRREGSAA